LSTKIHVLVDALGNPFNLMLTPGQNHDVTAAEPLLETADPRALIGDKAYDSDALIEALEQRAITAVIPPRENRKERRPCDFALYRERNLAERFWNKIKHYRGIATRYDKLARNFLGAVHLVSGIILLN
jgi:transposase